VAATGPHPDLPATPGGLQAGYFTYPKDLVKSVSQPPGVGSDVTAIAQTSVAPPPALADNPAWQAMNTALNANMKIQVVPTTEYATKLSVMIAGSDFPDLLFFTHDLAVTGLPQFLQATYQDLTPFLAGEAIKEYANLAAIPTSAWLQSRVGGSIYAVPVIRPYFNWVWYVNQTKLDAIGADQPKNADDFKRILQEMTRPQSNEYGLGANPPSLGLITSGKGDSPMQSMFGAPNNWAVDSNGKFTKDFETEQFRAALSFVRELYAMGVYYPDPNLNTTSASANFVGGRIGVLMSGWIRYPEFHWNSMAKLDPPQQCRVFHPFSADGGQPIWHRFQAVNGLTGIKKAAPDRVRELLRILNFLAAPFGTQEFHLVNYGVKDVDYTLDDSGSPVLTKKGQADVSVGWDRLAVPMSVLFNPTDPNFVKVAYADEQALAPLLLADATEGLDSPTDNAKGPPLTQHFSDGLGDIVTGRSPLSVLDDLIRQWRSGGGDQIRTEYQQAFAQSDRHAMHIFGPGNAREAAAGMHSGNPG
jgi:putative aldouronate transport system substrate-binding protein